MTVFENSYLEMHKTKVLPDHSNGMRFTAFDQSGRVLHSEIYYSIGGGFVLTEDQIRNPSKRQSGAMKRVPVYDLALIIIIIYKFQNRGRMG